MSRSGPGNGPPPGARSRTRSRTGRWACPAGLTTCRAGSAAQRRSPTSRGRWRARGARTFRICELTELTPGPGWTSWWRWGAAPGSGCTPATCGAARPASKRPSGRRTTPASASPSTPIPTAGPARSWHRCSSRRTCRRAARSRRWRTWPTPGSARHCSRRTSSPARAARYHVRQAGPARFRGHQAPASTGTRNHGHPQPRAPAGTGTRRHRRYHDGSRHVHRLRRGV